MNTQILVFLSISTLQFVIIFQIFIFHFLFFFNNKFFKHCKFSKSRKIQLRKFDNFRSCPNFRGLFNNKFKNEKICKITKIFKKLSSFGIIRLFDISRYSHYWPFYIWAFINFQIWNVSHSKILLFEILTLTA